MAGGSKSCLIQTLLVCFGCISDFCRELLKITIFFHITASQSKVFHGDWAKKCRRLRTDPGSKHVYTERFHQNIEKISSYGLTTTFVKRQSGEQTTLDWFRFTKSWRYIYPHERDVLYTTSDALPYVL